jgi:hypothetical protein
VQELDLTAETSWHEVGPRPRRWRDEPDRPTREPTMGHLLANSKISLMPKSLARPGPTASVRRAFPRGRPPVHCGLGGLFGGRWMYLDHSCRHIGRWRSSVLPVTLSDHRGTATMPEPAALFSTSTLYNWGAYHGAY